MGAAFSLTPSDASASREFSRCVDLICRLYGAANGRRCPWDTACGHNLKLALRRLRGAEWTLEQIEAAIRNKFRSEENPLASPKTWLGHLEEYAGGPRNKYGDVAWAQSPTPPAEVPISECRGEVPEVERRRREQERRAGLAEGRRRGLRDFDKHPIEEWEQPLADGEYAAARERAASLREGTRNLRT